jgi:predicted  nucleic acid-binding Zn-ribbon protein
VAAVGDNGQQHYNLNDFQMRQLIDRLNVRSATFSRNLRQDLNRASYNDRNSLDEVRQQLSQFETALVQLRNRVNSRQVNVRLMCATFWTARRFEQLHRRSPVVVSD